MDELNEESKVPYARTKEFVEEMAEWPITQQCVALSMIIDTIATPQFTHEDIIEGLHKVCDGRGFEMQRRLQ